MNAHAYIRKSFAKTLSTRSATLRARLVKWNKQPRIVRVEHSANPSRAHGLGYKATKEFVIVRVRMGKGNRSRPAPKLGRKPGKNVKRVAPGRSLQWFATQKALRTHRNMSVVGSYFVGESGTDHYFEVILREMHSHVPKPLSPKARKALAAKQLVSTTKSAVIPSSAKPVARPAVAKSVASPTPA